MKNKHKITSNNFGSFIRNIKTLHEEVEAIGHKITDMRIKMTTLNGDYEGYSRRYVGRFWTKENNNE